MTNLYNLEKLRSLALTDSLSDLPNRYYIETLLRSKISEHAIFPVNFGIIFFDLDFFKDLNDRYGHEAGDMVLKNVSKTFSHNIRNADHIGRWGGDEFVGVCVCPDAEALKTVAEKMRILVENTSTQIGDLTLQATLSAGATMTDVPNSGGVWAPCLSYDNGLFYLVFSITRTFEETTQDTENYLTWAPTPQGPWAPRVPLHCGGFDASLFHAPDGSKWIVGMRWDSRHERNHFPGIYLQRYNPQTRRLEGDARLIFSGTALGLTEGPHLYRHDGLYYLMTAEGGTSEGHEKQFCGYPHGLPAAGRANGLDRRRANLFLYGVLPDEHGCVFPQMAGRSGRRPDPRRRRAPRGARYHQRRERNRE